MILGVSFFSGTLASMLFAPLLVVVVIYGYKMLKKYITPDNFGVVEEGRIYRSGQLYPFLLGKVIAKYGIKTIACFRVYEMSKDEYARFKSVCDYYEVRLVSIEMTGEGVGGFAQYDYALGILCDAANHPVLVCCGRGVYRTGGAIAIYRILKQSWSFEEALKEMTRYGFRPYRHRDRGMEHPMLPHIRKYLKTHA